MMENMSESEALLKAFQDLTSVSTDDGVYYDSYEIAKEIGISVNSLHKRFSADRHFYDATKKNVLEEKWIPLKIDKSDFKKINKKIFYSQTLTLVVLVRDIEDRARINGTLEFRDDDGIVPPKYMKKNFMRVITRLKNGLKEEGISAKSLENINYLQEFFNWENDEYSKLVKRYRPLKN